MRAWIEILLHPTPKAGVEAWCLSDAYGDRHAGKDFPPSPSATAPARLHMAASEALPSRTLVEEFLHAVSDGRLHISDAAEWASTRVQEGGADASMTALACCGGSNGERNLHAWVERQPWRKVLPKPYSFAAPQRTAEGGAAMGTLHCLLPHDIFASLHAEAPRVFMELFGSAEERQAYWAEIVRTVQQLPAGHRKEEHRHWLHRHPARHAEPCCRVPLGLHGDGGEMHKGEKITVVSWGGGLCRRGRTVDTRLLFIALKESAAVEGRATLHQAFKVLVWSFAALTRGQHPAHDHDDRPFGPDHFPDRALLAGKALAVGPDGPLCGAFCEKRGDWPYLRDALGLKNNFGAHQVCHLCNAVATPGPMFFGDHFQGEGPLVQTLKGPFHTGPDCWEATSPHSPLLQMPGFSIWRCMYDLMHALDLGLLQRVIPAALHGLMGEPPSGGVAMEESLWPGSSREKRCKAATFAYREWARKNVASSARVKRITPRWVTGDQPNISMEHAKAAALRAMLPWVAEEAQKRDGASEVAGLRARCLRELAALDELYKGKPRFLSRPDEAQAQAHCTAALESLARLCSLQPAGPWKITPKAHALWHIAHHSAMGNPRVAHCYQDEDFVGVVKRIYRSCHGRSAPLRVLQRYCMGISLQLTAREELMAGKRAAKATLKMGGPQRGMGVCGPPGPAGSSSSSSSTEGSVEGSSATAAATTASGSGTQRAVRGRSGTQRAVRASASSVNAPSTSAVESGGGPAKRGRGRPPSRVVKRARGRGRPPKEQAAASELRQ